MIEVNNFKFSQVQPQVTEFLLNYKILEAPLHNLVNLEWELKLFHSLTFIISAIIRIQNSNLLTRATSWTIHLKKETLALDWMEELKIISWTIFSSSNNLNKVVMERLMMLILMKLTLLTVICSPLPIIITFWEVHRLATPNSDRVREPKIWPIYITNSSRLHSHHLGWHRIGSSRVNSNHTLNR